MQVFLLSTTPGMTLWLAVMPPPSFHTYVKCTADGQRYFKLQIINWSDTNVEIGDKSDRIRYYCDEPY